MVTVGTKVVLETVGTKVVLETGVVLVTVGTKVVLETGATKVVSETGATKVVKVDLEMRVVLETGATKVGLVTVNLKKSQGPVTIKDKVGMVTLELEDLSHDQPREFLIQNQTVVEEAEAGAEEDSSSNLDRYKLVQSEM